jgi:hypothetical protein
VKGNCQVAWQIGGEKKDNAEFPAGLISTYDTDSDGNNEIFTLSDGTLELRSGKDGAIKDKVLVTDAALPTAIYMRDLQDDLDGDGHNDVAVFLADCGNNGQGGGASGSMPCTRGVRVVSSATRKVILSLIGPAQDETYAPSATVVPDVDGDGKRDLAVSWTSNDPNAGNGHIDLVSSATKKVVRSITPPGVGASFGSSLLSGADLDGDGTSDFIVGDPAFNVLKGRVWAISGATSAVLWSVDGDELDTFGDVLTWGGDLDGDGAREILVGVHNHSLPGTPGMDLAEAAGEVVALRAKTGAKLWSALGERAQEGFGLTLASPGDANGDGKPDVLVGAPKQLSLPTADGHGGVVEILSGKDGSTLVQIEETIHGNDATHPVFGYRLGNDVATIAAPDASKKFIIAASAPRAPWQGFVRAGRVVAFRCSE